MFKAENLTAVTQRVLSQQTHLGQTVEHHAQRFILANLLEDHLGGFAELHLGGMEKGDFMIRTVACLRRHQLETRDAPPAPPGTRRPKTQLRLTFRKSDVEHPFTSLDAFQEELECERSLTRPGRTFDEIQPVGIQSTTQDVIQA